MIFTKKVAGTMTEETGHLVAANVSFMLAFDEFMDQLVSQGKTDGIAHVFRNDGFVVRERNFTDQSAVDEYMIFCNTRQLQAGYDISLVAGDL
jgi:hypothetical protein